MYAQRASVAEYHQANRAVHGSEDPHRVILLLLGGAIQRVRYAEACLARHDAPGRVQALNGALDIIEGLRLSLDHAAGGEIATRLEAMYEYMTFRLVEANQHQDGVRLREVADLLGVIESAWRGIAQDAEPARTGIAASASASATASVAAGV